MEVVLVPEPVAAALDHTDLVVHPLDKAERYFVLRPAIGSDAFPVPLHQLRKLLEGTEPLPAQGAAPPVEELPCPHLAPIIPELGELLLQDVGRVEPLVGCKERLERATLLR